MTNLPLSPPPTIDEINRIFSRCGVIAEEIDARKPRIKLYTNEDGSFKGDALIVYFRAESVDLAIQMLDDSELRLGETKDGMMRVTAADFSYKKVKNEGGAEDGNANAKEKGGDRKKIIKKTQKMNKCALFLILSPILFVFPLSALPSLNASPSSMTHGHIPNIPNPSKLADWSDDDTSALPETSSRWDKVVILKHMFTLAELAEDPAAMLDIKEDIRVECSKMGDVTNVVLFDLEPEGIASVRFSSRESAEACVRVMAGRHFDGRVVEAYVADGGEKFRKSSSKKDIRDEEGDDEEGGGDG